LLRIGAVDEFGSREWLWTQAAHARSFEHAPHKKLVPTPGL
jgi:hypothetical protein